MITDRIDNITSLKPEYRSKVLKAPESVKIELTGKCNFSCHFCARSMVLRDQKHMDQKFYSRIIKEMFDSGVRELGLFYLGESFLCPWLKEAVREAKEIGFPYVFLTTNGSLCAEKKVREVMDAGLNSLKFSFNYSGPEQLTEIAKVKGSIFDTIVENIKDAWETRELYGYDCGLYASYIEYDGEQGERMREAIRLVEPYLDEIYALPLYNQANLVKEREEGKGWIPTAGNRGRAGNLREPIPCWAVFTEGHITWDGKLSACCFDHNNSFSMADLNEVSFLEGWNSLSFQNLRAAHLDKNLSNTPCEHCVAYQ